MIRLTLRWNNPFSWQVRSVSIVESLLRSLTYEIFLLIGIIIFMVWLRRRLVNEWIFWTLIAHLRMFWLVIVICPRIIIIRSLRLIRIFWLSFLLSHNLACLIFLSYLILFFWIALFLNQVNRISIFIKILT